MDLASAHLLLDGVGSTSSERAALLKVIADCHRLSSWVESRRLAAVAQLEGIADVSAPHEVALASKTSRFEGDRVVQRAAAAHLMPELADALSEGAVNARHLDAAANVLRRAEPEQRERLAERSKQWGRAATNMSVGEFQKFAEKELRAVQTDDGIARFEQQRRDARLRVWTNEASGMVCGQFSLDPEAGGRFLGRLRNTVESLFHDRQPDTCPTHPIERQEHLQALAIMAMLSGTSSASSAGRAELNVVIDLQTLRNGLHERSICTVSDGVELPVETIRRLACDAHIAPAVLGTQGEVLDMGRRARLATPAQRRALRVMCTTCWIPGCDVPFDDCTMHHVDPWERGGVSDLNNFRPACNRHHHDVHEGGWKVEADGWWTIITLPDGTVMHTGPPIARAA